MMSRACRRPLPDSWPVGSAGPPSAPATVPLRETAARQKAVAGLLGPGLPSPCPSSSPRVQRAFACSNGSAEGRGAGSCLRFGGGLGPEGETPYTLHSECRHADLRREIRLLQGLVGSLQISRSRFSLAPARSRGPLDGPRGGLRGRTSAEAPRPEETGGRPGPWRQDRRRPPRAVLPCSSGTSFVLLGPHAAVATPALGGSAGFGRRETHQAPGGRSCCQSWEGVRLSEPFRGLVSRPPQGSTGRSWPYACPSTASAGCIRLGSVREVGMESSGSTHFRSAPCGGLARSGVGDLVELDKFPSTRCRGLPGPAALLGKVRLVVQKKGAVLVGAGEAIFDQRSAKS